MINPVQFVQFMRNPELLMQEFTKNPQIQNNPIAKNAFELYQKGDIKGINDLAENLAKEKGVDINKIRKQLGI